MIGVFPARLDIMLTKDDVIDMTFFVERTLDGVGQKFYSTLNIAPDEAVSYSMTSISMRVKRQDGLVIKEWISGVSPSNIVCDGSNFHLYDDAGIGESGYFDYEVKDETRGIVIIRGKIWSRKNIVP